MVKHDYPQGVMVYNFEVDGDHTYFVGNANGGTWVHNDCTSIAQDLRAAGNEGDVYRLELDPNKFPEPLRGKLDLGNGRGWNYHDVLHNPQTGEVYDPMTYGHSNPVPFEQWKTNFPYWEDYQWGVSPAN